MVELMISLRTRSDPQGLCGPQNKGHTHHDFIIQYIPNSVTKV